MGLACVDMRNVQGVPDNLELRQDIYFPLDALKSIQSALGL